MSRNDNPDREDIDDGTWHQSMQSPPTIPPEDLTRVKTPGLDSSEVQTPPVHHTIAGAESTETPSSTAVQKDSGDSDEVTPRPGGERSDDWDLLPAPLIKKGQLVFGKYLLEEKLGKGGMGEVWRVENMPLQKETALKLIDPRFAQDDKGWRRFEREARVMARITHPNAVAVYDFRRMHSMAYIEMELVSGCSLEKYLSDRKTPVSLEWTAHLLDQLCSVLQEAHGHIDKKTGKAKPIIHRDLKPSNLMLAEDRPEGQNLKVLDFGIAKMVHDEGSPELTGMGDFVGTPHYMSPEQIRGGVGKDGRGEIDGRSDLYSVGVLLYQLLTGTLPFCGRSNLELLAAHLQQAPLPMNEANPRANIPPQVQRLVMKCLEKDPDLRPQSAEELARLFREAIKGLVQPSRFKGLSKRFVLPIAAGCVLLSIVAVGVPRLRDRLWRGPSAVEPGEKGKQTGLPETFANTIRPGGESPVRPDRDAGLTLYPVWASRGYEPLSDAALRSTAREKGDELTTLASDLAGAPAGLKRNADRMVFYAFSKGVYLPLGYRPEDPDDLRNFRPRALVRAKDKVRFLFIEGGKFTCGDFQAADSVADKVGNPCTAHEVEVSDFYIQETEVTNLEMEEFQKRHHDAKLQKWRESLEFFKAQSPGGALLSFPAVCMDRATAQMYARSVAGRLPTEAEWEYAARSGGREYLWAWKNARSKRGAPKARLFNGAALETLPVPVKSYKGDDETDQGVLDMTGNVREWCLDVYEAYDRIIAENKSQHKALINPRVGDEPPPDGSELHYVVRGGSFLTTSDEAMVFQRAAESAASELNDVGFRVVIQCPPLIGETAD